MKATPREFVDRLGGYREVAARLGVSEKTIHGHATANKLPPRWYVALCELAKERGLPEPEKELFSFIPFPSRDEVTEHTGVA